MKKINAQDLFRNKVAVFLVAGVAVIGLGLGAYGLYNYVQQQNSTESVDGETVLKDITTGQLPLNNADTKEKLEASLDSVDDNEKFQVYLLLANEYTAAGDYKKAAQAYRDAEEMGGLTPDLAFSAAAAYEQSGDKNSALSYYKKTKELLEGDNDGQGSNTFMSRVDAKIRELEG